MAEEEGYQILDESKSCPDYFTHQIDQLKTLRLKCFQLDHKVHFLESENLDLKENLKTIEKQNEILLKRIADINRLWFDNTMKNDKSNAKENCQKTNVMAEHFRMQMPTAASLSCLELRGMNGSNSFGFTNDENRNIQDTICHNHKVSRAAMKQTKSNLELKSVNCNHQNSIRSKENLDDSNQIIRKDAIVLKGLQHVSPNNELRMETEVFSGQSTVDQGYVSEGKANTLNDIDSNVGLESTGTSLMGLKEQSENIDCRFVQRQTQLYASNCNGKSCTEDSNKLKSDFSSSFELRPLIMQEFKENALKEKKCVEKNTAYCTNPNDSNKKSIIYPTKNIPVNSLDYKQIFEHILYFGSLTDDHDFYSCLSSLITENIEKNCQNEPSLSICFNEGGEFFESLRSFHFGARFVEKHPASPKMMPKNIFDKLVRELEKVKDENIHLKKYLEKLIMYNSQRQNDNKIDRRPSFNGEDKNCQLQISLESAEEEAFTPYDNEQPPKSMNFDMHDADKQKVMEREIKELYSMLSEGQTKSAELEKMLLAEKRKTGELVRNLMTEKSRADTIEGVLNDERKRFLRDMNYMKQKFSKTKTSCSDNTQNDNSKVPSKQHGAIPKR